MKRDDLVSVEKVGIGLLKLTVSGKSATRKYENSMAEVILDEDDVDELLEDIRKAQNDKVSITR